MSLIPGIFNLKAKQHPAFPGPNILLFQEFLKKNGYSKRSSFSENFFKSSILQILWICNFCGFMGYLVFGLWMVVWIILTLQ